MADMTQPATLGNLQKVVENMKVYVDSDKTTSIKGYLKKNNTHNFYNTSTPTEDTTPIFSFDVGEEMSLDQTKTTFVQEFEWSDENYPNSTNPNLDGQAVLVLATKSNDVVSYSFVNLETLVDTYKTKNTTTLSLDITDNEISGNVNISAEDGNAVVIKDDGLYVPTTAETKVSETEGNQIEVKEDGLFVKDMSAKVSAETDNAIEVKDDGLYVPTVLETKVSEIEDNIIENKEDGIYVAPTDLSDYATTEYVDNAVKDIDLTGYATETYVDDKIENLSLGDENVIESISVNGENVEIDENKNVDITIPEAPIKTISQDGTALAIDENGNVDIPIADTNKIEVVKVNGVELEINDTDRSVDITVPDEYDDTTLSDRVTETENAIATLNGVGEGSVSKTVDDALNKFATDLSDDGVVNTYKELVDYAANHSSDVAEMVADIAENTTAIEELNTKIADIEIPSLNGYAKTEDIPTVTNDLTDELKEKYDKAEENVQSDWEETDETSDAFIKNKPTIPSTDGLATETFVTDKIAEAQLGGEEVDLSSYVKTETLTDELAKYSTTEVSDEKYVLDEEIDVLDVTAIESMIGLNSDEILGLASLLSDQTIELGKTWSSSYIYGKLNETLDSAKAYTLQELSKAIGASYKVVSSTSDVTETSYIYLIENGTTYDMYILNTDTNSAVQIGTTEIDLSGFYTKSESEDLFATKADVVANYATKTELQDYAVKIDVENTFATKEELTNAIADIEVEISTDENNQLENRENGLFVGSETITISKADYDALSVEEKSNGKTYFVPDDETTEDGTDLTQFAKVSDLEDGTITVGNSKKLNGLTKDELFAETNNKISAINNNLAQLIKTTTVTASADISANSSVFMSVSVPETPSGYRRLFAFIQGGSGSIDTSQLLIGSGTTGCRVYNNLSQKQTVTIECQIVYIKNC